MYKIKRKDNDKAIDKIDKICSTKKIDKKHKTDEIDKVDKSTDPMI